MQPEMEPDLCLLEIAAALGFHDEFHMRKAFKQKYGISPQRYRRPRLTGEEEKRKQLT